MRTSKLPCELFRETLGEAEKLTLHTRDIFIYTPRSDHARMIHEVDDNVIAPPRSEEIYDQDGHSSSAESEDATPAALFSVQQRGSWLVRV